MMIQIVTFCLLIGLSFGRIVPEEDTQNIHVQPRRSFDGCKLDQDLRFSNNVFYHCASADKASEAALSISPPGSRHGMCHDPHKPGFYAHYHPAGHTEMDGLNYHFHWGSKDYGQCPWTKPKGGNSNYSNNNRGGNSNNYRGNNNNNNRG